MASEDTYLDLINRREVSVSQFSTHLLKEYGLANLDEAYRAARLILLDAEEITSRTKLNQILSEINKTVTPMTTASNAAITAQLNAFGAAEAIFAATTLKQFTEQKVKTPAKRKTIDYIEKSIMSLESGTSSVAGVWSEFIKDNTDNLTKTINNQIKTGYANQESTQSIVKRIKASTQGVSANAIERLVRTGTAHYSQQANNYFIEDNKDLELEEHVFVTFDSRTSDICISVNDRYSGKSWPVGESPFGYPPLHPFCRTIIRALPKGVEPEGLRPAIGGKKGDAAEEAFERKKDYAEARGSTVVKRTGRSDKAFNVEQIPVKTPFSKFLRDQPYWYVKQTLGKARTDAFLSGKLDLSNLTDRQLKSKTLAQLGLD